MTDDTFPVNYNTAVTVRCTGDKVLTGDNVITCIKGTEFRFEDEHKCNHIGKFYQGFVYQLMNIYFHNEQVICRLVPFTRVI